MDEFVDRGPFGQAHAEVIVERQGAAVFPVGANGGADVALDVLPAGAVFRGYFGENHRREAAPDIAPGHVYHQRLAQIVVAAVARGELDAHEYIGGQPEIAVVGLRLRYGAGC